MATTEKGFHNFLRELLYYPQDEISISDIIMLVTRATQKVLVAKKDKDNEVLMRKPISKTYNRASYFKFFVKRSAEQKFIKEKGTIQRFIINKDKIESYLKFKNTAK